ncbi:major facilitator superfamily transporter [Rhizoctonia solani]|uniref:Major facilitator superfamily transporter n=1 Tax=Rhizoctonia solani TaxID=456999 RepID=A0A8H8T118_9AGAM|nr:major facilitator superfamily transporter [Rhizoctonia solani]QRW24297.1 major facilitator superfamily transporter [Rhizoctonia solani]
MSFRHHIAFGVFICEKVDESGTSGPYNASVGSHTLDEGKANTHLVGGSVSSQDQVGQSVSVLVSLVIISPTVTHTDTLSALPGRMIAPGLPEIAHAFGITNSTVAALTLSIFILAYAIGPLFVTPLSEVYGRSWPLHLSNIFFLVFNLACAWAPDTASLIVFRFFAGIGGSAPLTIGAGSIADLFHERDRAVAMSLFSLGPLMGPIIGPIAGGFITQNVGYPWVFKIISIVAGIATIFGIPLLQETYAPVLKRRYGYQDSGPSGSLGEVLSENLRRPLRLLMRSMICFSLSLYMAIIYGLLYLMFVTFPTLFASVYGWGPGIAGLAYLGLGIGFMFAAVIGSRLMNTLYLKLSERNGGQGKPEYRIPPMLFGTVLIVIGLFWYGWTAHVKAHYILPIIGSGIFGAGMMFCFMPIQLYLVDSFTYAASAIAAATFLRSLFGFAFPLFGIAIVVGVPFPMWIYFKGEQMRARNPLNR